MKYRRLIKYALRQWPAFVGILVLSALSSAMSVLQPWPLKLAIDYALGATSVPESLGSLISRVPAAPAATLLIVAAILSLVLFALNSLLDVGITRAWTSYGEGMVYEFAGDLFYKLQRASLLSTSRRKVGDVLSRLTDDVYCVYGVLESIISPMRNILTLATVGYVAWRLDPRLAAFALSIAPFQACSAVFFARRLKKRAKQTRARQSVLFGFIHQTLTAIPLVQAFGAEQRNALQFQRLAADAVTLSQRATVLESAYTFVNGLTTVLSGALILYAGSQRVLAGAVSTGSLIVFIAYSKSIQESLTGLLSRYVAVKQLEVTIDRSLEILDLEPGVAESPGAKPLSTANGKVRGHVRLENVTFGYEPSRTVLQDVTVEARPGEIVAFVGSTGAGKSTLVSLVVRFCDPWQGRVTIDGVDLRDVQVASLRDNVALVLQDPLLLPLTVADNIAYGRPEARRDEIVAAAVAANADRFICRLPSGYDTVLGERGATLSGGEKQRISIARALLKNAPILILDEPTSALDAETEASLLEALDRLTVGRTTLIVAHRLSTIRNADRIVVLEDGRVAETGTPAELLTRNGQYRRFHSLQFGLLANEAAE